ncbi:MOXD1 homolog 1 [Fopius arisanus]|uniref:MOXD1 homolog 1 n=1 Tax=Fopius arisanus TaxID=64838 RepID=A0A9R1T2H1_9HYME|nr:PREDICTED: MOXD1 homolog 1 [Fopius arisanus]
MKILGLLLTLFLMVEADLLDLYVQHMDETMGTNNIKKHPKDTVSKTRSKRYLKGAMRYGHFRKQRLDVEDDWWIDKRVLKKPLPKLPISKPDGLDFPNLKETNRNDDHEIVRKKQLFQASEGFDIDRIAGDTESIDEVSIAPGDEVMQVLKRNHTRIPKKYHLQKEAGALKDFRSPKQKRSASKLNFTRHEVLDEVGDVILEWDPSDEVIITFKVTARTLGYVGIGFNDKNHMKGADLLLAWIDDHDNSVNVLDSHGLEDDNAAPVADESQDIDILGGSQNDTHTIITFSRRWQTCDPEDRHLNEDNVRVLWALQDTDPELNTPLWHGERRGARPLRLGGAVPKPPPPHNPDIRHWDVKLNQFAVDDKQDTIYWCKIFKAPPFNKKHHMIGYEPLVEKGNEGLVHHMILYECASTSSELGKYSRIVGSYCYDPTMPKEWETCIRPIVAWARGSKGEWFAEHVGIPVAEHKEGSYMLEVHYNNPTLKKAIDSSGIRLHLTPVLRPNEAGIFVAGVAVSPLHLIPPRQREYATAGYCSPDCTEKLLPEDGVNVISVVLHSHLAGRRLSLKHIRNGQELPHIAHENHFDFDYQQSHSLAEEVKILPGDELVTECVYDTHDRPNPTLGGYAASQEMCLSFVVYYPRTELAGCYSMTPATDLFKTLGVSNFKGVSLDNLEKLFLTTGVEAVTLPTIVQQQLPVYPATRPSEEIDETVIKETETAIKAIKEFTEQVTDDNVFARLVIEEPKEFKGRTLAEHMSALAWTDELLTRPIENTLYHGRHMTFCRKRDDKLAIPSDIQSFPNFTRLPEKNQTVCRERRTMSSGAISVTLTAALYIIALSISLC